GGSPVGPTSEHLVEADGQVEVALDLELALAREEPHREHFKLVGRTLTRADSLEPEPGVVHHSVDEELARDLGVLLPPEREELHRSAELLGEDLDREPSLSRILPR